MDEQKERREGGLRRTLLPGNATPSPPWLTHSIHSSQALILQNRPGCSLKPKGDSQVRAQEQRNWSFSEERSFWVWGQEQGMQPSLLVVLTSHGSAGLSKIGTMVLTSSVLREKLRWTGRMPSRGCGHAGVWGEGPATLVPDSVQGVAHSCHRHLSLCF